MRRWFGPSREEIWRRLSEEVGGTFVDGGFWKDDKVEVAHGDWTVTLDRYVVSTGKVTVVYTRMRAPYVNPDGFRFSVYRAGLFSGIGKLLGMQDIEVGHEPFDTDFVVKGNDESKVRRLFSNPAIRDLVAAQPEIRFDVNPAEHGWFSRKYPENTDELSFMVTGVVKDIERLKQVYALFAATLDELTRMGAAYQRAPERKDG